jgi:hypothetical protein
MATCTGFHGPSDEPGVLHELRAVRTARTELERRESVLVRRARHRGYVWEQIADCLGVSKQAVHKKHAGRFNRSA